MKSKPVILCVDDEKIILECLKRQIHTFYDGECVIELAESGEEGMEIIEDLRKSEQYPHLIISDQIMPGMRGHEFLTNVHVKYPDIVKILLTGMVQNEDIEKAFEQADLYRIFMKPWSVDELNEAINQGLSTVENLN